MPRLSAPIAVVISAALIASIGAGSYAAGALITGKQIKDGTIQVKDLSPKTVKKLRGATGAAGATGATGAAGAAGGQGVRGASAFEPVPSGTTIKGGWYVDGHADAVGQDFGAATPLTGLAASNLGWADNVFFAPSAAADDSSESAQCTGTSSNPTAPAGTTCVYVSAASFSAVVHGYTLEASRNAFGVYATAGIVGDILAAGTWAYTAP